MRYFTVANHIPRVQLLWLFPLGEDALPLIVISIQAVLQETIIPSALWPQTSKFSEIFLNFSLSEKKNKLG